MKQSKFPPNVDSECNDITLRRSGVSLLLTSVPVRLIAALVAIAALWLMLSFLI